MDSRFIKYIMLFCIVLSTTLLHGQEKNQGKGDRFMSHLREKVLLHTDRDIYLSGERVWFRADYLLNGKKEHDPLSKILYLQLYPESGDVVAEKKYRISKGLAKGNFTLPEDLATGRYILRAYTRYQRNFVETGFTHRQILVIDPSKSTASPTTRNAGNIRILPEGGEWVEGIPNRLAIVIPPIMMKNAHSIRVTGRSKQPLQPLEPSAEGVAKIKLTPSDTMNYRLEIITHQEDTIRKKFPPPKERGISASVHLKNNHLVYKLHTKAGGSDRHEKDHHLQLLSDNLRKVYERKIQLNQDRVDLAIPYDSLRQGIHYAVLYDHRNAIRKINPVYVPADKPQTITIQTDKQVYKPREKISMELQSHSGPVESSSVSVTVTQKGTYTEEINHLSPVNMHNSHLLRETLSTKDKPLLKEQLELSMILFHHLHLKDDITSRISADSNPPIKHLPETRDLSITGTIKNRDTQKPITGKQVCLAVHSGNPQFHIYKTTQKGNFYFTVNNPSGLQNIYLYPFFPGKEERNFKLSLNRNFHGGSPPYFQGNHPLDSSYKPLLEEIYVNHQISNTKQKKESQGDEKPPASLFSYFGHRVHSIDLDDYIKLDDMEQVFLELLPQVQVREKEEDYTLRIVVDGDYHRMLPGDPLIFVDNIPIFDHAKIMELHPSQVEKIGVVNEPYILGDNAFNGIILIATNTEHFAGIETPESSVFAEYQGIAKSRAFHEKHYGVNQQNMRKPDFRTLLFWNPDVKLKNGSATLTFHASDRRAQYDIVVRGFCNGEYVYGKKTFSVSDAHKGK